MNRNMNNAIIIIIADKMKLPWESYSNRYLKAFQSSKLWKVFFVREQGDKYIASQISRLY